MKDITSKEKILTNIRNALLEKSDNPFENIDFTSDVLVESNDDKYIQFATNLKDNGGVFGYAENKTEAFGIVATLIDENRWENIFCPIPEFTDELSQYDIITKNTPEDFKDVDVAITTCDFLISRCGSVMVSSGLGLGRQIFSFPETLIIIANTSHVVNELKDAIDGIKGKYVNNFPSQITVITGPSRTADIEKTLVMGAHGSKNIYVFLIVGD